MLFVPECGPVVNVVNVENVVNVVNGLGPGVTRVTRCPLMDED